MGGGPRAWRLEGRTYATAATVATVAVIAVTVVGRLVSTVNPVDFLVYRYAAQAVLAGTPLYDGWLQGPLLPVGGMPLTYPPVAAIALLPTTIGPAGIAVWTWNLASLLALGWVLARLTPARTRNGPLVVAGALGAASFTCLVTQHLSFGQIDLLLMSLCLADVLRGGDSAVARWVPRGALVGLAAAIKLTSGLFTLFLALTRQWRVAASSLGVAAGATLLAAVLQPSASWTFWTSTVWRLGDRVDFDGTGYRSYGNGSVFGVFAWVAPQAGRWPAAVALVAAVAGLAAARRAHRQGREVDAWIIVGLLAPVITPVAWVHHFVYLIPALYTLAVRRPTAGRGLVIGAAWLALVAGPGVGDRLLAVGGAAVLPGAVVREMLPLLSIACIAALASGPSERALLPASGPVVDLRDPPAPVGPGPTDTHGDQDGRGSPRYVPNDQRLSCGSSRANSREP